MTAASRASLLPLLFVLWSSPCFAQTEAPPSAVVLAPEDMEQFLLQASIVGTKKAPKGVTDARRVTLSDGRVTHDAQIQHVDIAKALFDVDPKHTEVNFKDSYRYNIAAYRLARLLGLTNVPMSVERVVGGKPSAVTWWIDAPVINESARQKTKAISPNPVRTDGYLNLMRVFDELIQNRDRNAGNMLWESDGRLWMIDHTRAFRTGKQLQQPKLLIRCERNFLDRMRGLARPAFAEAMGKILTKDESDALFARRDLLVQLFDQQIAARGEAGVLYSLQ
ncbi:MAG TPA: hypothetical protein VI485_22345 [Vicinamibacterales bacterium]|nr:hypothetical protein [Vicinamibacterales bacterium]